jgi:hypothetical protein
MTTLHTLIQTALYFDNGELGVPGHGRAEVVGCISGIVIIRKREDYIE